VSHFIYTDFALFSTGKAAPVAAGNGDLFSDHGELYVVLGQGAANNVEPFVPRWSLLFVGTGGDLQKSFLPALSESFGDLGSRSQVFAGGQAAEQHIRKLFLEARTLTLDRLHSLGIVGYSWSSDVYQVLKTSNHIGGLPVPYTDCGEERFGYLLGDQSDLDLLIEQASSVTETVRGVQWFARPELHAHDKRRAVAGF
jgi:hypothetical protein